jgi:ribosome biogenesis GTPase
VTLRTPPVGVVLAREGSSYRVLLDGIEHTAVLRGRARHAEDRAVAGDRVTLDPATLGEPNIAITGVEPRRNVLERRNPEGRGTRPVAANVDQLVLVTAAIDPEPVLQLIDRLLAVAESDDIAAVVVVNKVDLAPPDTVVAHLAAAGYPVIGTSVKRGDGIAALRQQLAGRESVLAGASGVGKSSLLNAIEPGLGLRVGEISARVRRGRHTTTTAAMVPLAEGGFVVDTPGFSEVGVVPLEAGALATMFPEFLALPDACRFADCRHRHEPGCAVRAAVAAGAIPAARHASYLTLLAELEGLPAHWE